MNLAENRISQNRAIRWQELTEISHKYSLGPEKCSNLELYEKFNRPLIKNYQKHPGHQVPEAQALIKVNEIFFIINIFILNWKFKACLKTFRRAQNYWKNLLK
jgi:hypothetical protein